MPAFSSWMGKCVIGKTTTLRQRGEMMGWFSNLINNDADVSFIRDSGFTWKPGVSSLLPRNPFLDCGAGKEEHPYKSAIIGVKVL